MQHESCEWLEEGEHKVQLRAQLKEGLWYLDILDQDGNRTLWEDGFASQPDALAEGRAAVKEAGVAFFIGNLDDAGASE